VAAGHLAASLAARLARHLTFSRLMGQAHERLLLALPSLSFLWRRRTVRPGAVGGQPLRWPAARVVASPTGEPAWAGANAPAWDDIDAGVPREPVDEAPFTSADELTAMAASAADEAASPPAQPAARQSTADGDLTAIHDPAARLAAGVLARHAANWTVLVGEPAVGVPEARDAVEPTDDTAGGEAVADLGWLSEPTWPAAGRDWADPLTALAAPLGPAGRAPWTAPQPVLARLARHHLAAEFLPGRTAPPQRREAAGWLAPAGAVTPDVPPVAARTIAAAAVVTPPLSTAGTLFTPPAWPAGTDDDARPGGAFRGSDPATTSAPDILGPLWPALLRPTASVATALAAAGRFAGSIGRAFSPTSAPGTEPASAVVAGAALTGEADTARAVSPPGLALALRQPLGRAEPGPVTGGSVEPRTAAPLPLPLSPAMPAPGLAGTTLPPPTMTSPAAGGMPATVVVPSPWPAEQEPVLPDRGDERDSVAAAAGASGAALLSPVSRAHVPLVRTSDDPRLISTSWPTHDSPAAGSGSLVPFVLHAPGRAADGPPGATDTAGAREPAPGPRPEGLAPRTPAPGALLPAALAGSLMPAVVARVTDLLRPSGAALPSERMEDEEATALAGAPPVAAGARADGESIVMTTTGVLTSLRPPLALSLQRRPRGGDAAAAAGPHGGSAPSPADERATLLPLGLPLPELPLHAMLLPAPPAATPAPLASLPAARLADGMASAAWREPALPVEPVVPGDDVVARLVEAALPDTPLAPPLTSWLPAARVWEAVAPRWRARHTPADDLPVTGDTSRLAARLVTTPGLPAAGLASGPWPLAPAATGSVDAASVTATPGTAMAGSGSFVPDAAAPATSDTPLATSDAPLSTSDTPLLTRDTPLAQTLRPILARAAGPQRVAAHQMTASTGTPLPMPVRDRFERLFGTALGDTEIHTDAAAGAATAALGAAAVTVGPRIFFAPGRFQPEEPAGDALLAHELVHVIQQRVGPPRMALKRLDGGSASEELADEPAAEAAEAGVQALHQAGAFAPQALPLARLPAPGMPASGGGESYTHFDLTGPALGTDAAPAIARIASTTYASESATIERAETGGTPDGQAGGEGGSGQGQGQGQDVRKLAQSVYEILKDDLIAERERRGRWL
jgi:hypothetical protein